MTPNQQKRYEKWLQSCLEYDWWGSIEEWFIEDCKPKGVRVHDIVFNERTAGFDGRVDLAIMMEQLKLHDQYPALYLAVKEDGSYANCTISHRGTQRIELIECWSNQTTPSGVFEMLDEDTWEALVLAQMQEADLESAATEFVKDLCHELFSALQSEQEYLTSEENFLEMGEVA